MENTQKVVVLCVAIIVVLVGGWFVTGDDKQNAETQIEPSSLQLETGPQNAETTEYPEVEPGDTLPPEVDEPGQELPPPETDPVACTMDAKQCPDGSYVGRVGPDCEFSECPAVPEEQTSATVCTPESKQVEACTDIYQPVCGLVQVQCFTTPCDPVPETFGNSCNACARGNVISYTDGACE